jgi:hypothetical protein
MHDDDAPVTPLADWRLFWENPEEQSDGPTEREFEADEAITAAEWPQLGEGWLLALNYTAWGSIPLRSFAPGLDENKVSVEIDSVALRSHLEIELGEDRLRFIVVSQDELPVQTIDVRLWGYLVVEASKAVRAPREMEWFAVIGTEPLGLIDASDQLLTEAATLGDLRLTPLGQLEEERRVTALGTHEQRSFSPVLVQGICRSWHDWGGDAEEEAIQVRRLCAFLSVAWNGCWWVKLLPQNRGLDELDLKPRGEIQMPEEDNLLSAPVTVSVEPWMSAALQQLAQDEWLSSALTAFHEGMLLYKDHPSIALIAFVSCCEAIGHRIGGQKTARQRVEAALSTVVSEEEAAELWQGYAHRNKTAHEGRLHGYELSFGLSSTKVLSPVDPALQFTWWLLRNFRDATRNALLLALKSPRANELH